MFCVAGQILVAECTHRSLETSSTHDVQGSGSNLVVEQLHFDYACFEQSNNLSKFCRCGIHIFLYAFSRDVFTLTLGMQRIKNPKKNQRPPAPLG
ncbi:unnamed protein product [Chrysodeixis includens]|uniref:Uncharacterized protein n=1 Tax=Chrysodeixis includens TaxID=689277 RepID=A0A9P0FWC5_CHRIL|nr:unnamed protein product [Chrysodeixis includens]